MDWDALFGVERPLILDIGFGYGHSLAYLQQARPDHNIVGIEVENTSLDKAERRVRREGWHNVRVIESFAETALAHLFVPGALAEVHVNFPDPWFKERHARRRLMKRPTLDAIVSRLATGGLFYLATDIRDYAEMSHDLLGQTPGLENVLASAWTTVRPEPFETKYEARAKREGRTCHYFVYRRNAQPAPAIPVITEATMPNVVFQSPLNLDAMHAQSHDLGASVHAEHTVRFLHTYRGERSVLFEVYLSEPTLDQRIALALVEKEDAPGTYTLKLSSLGHPRPTLGAHIAVRRLADHLLALHPDTTVIHDKVSTTATEPPEQL